VWLGGGESYYGRIRAYKGFASRVVLSQARPDYWHMERKIQGRWPVAKSPQSPDGAAGRRRYRRDGELIAADMDVKVDHTAYIGYM